MNPKVSILLPNLNNRPFLDERMASIIGQSFSDWELIIVDNHSDDGAWEFFQDWSAKDGRIRISQAPRNGMYANWNNAIRLAEGQYVYIATSDDTMRPDCIEKMVAGLEEYPECGICDCCLTIIDEQGRELAGRWESFVAQRYFGDLNRKRHIRKAPHDGIIQFALMSAHVSITQVLIRKQLLDRVGLFESRWGSAGDFEWHMRASLVTDVLHLPEYLASWRVHEKQATQHTTNLSTRIKLLEMCRHAVESVKSLDPELTANLDRDYKALSKVYKRDVINYGLRDIVELKSGELSILLATMAGDPIAAARALLRRFARLSDSFDRVHFMRDYLRNHWTGELIMDLEEGNTSGTFTSAPAVAASAARAQGAIETSESCRR